MNNSLCSTVDPLPIIVCNIHSSCPLYCLCCSDKVHNTTTYLNFAFTPLSDSLGEQSRVDHLVFVVHGIGAHHDLSFRSLVDCGKSVSFLPPRDSFSVIIT